MNFTKKKHFNFFTNCLIISGLISAFTTSCHKRPLPPKIGNNLSFPGKLAALNSSHFLLLNTVANNMYQDGSIQLYSVSSSGTHTLLNSLSIPTHATDIAVSNDSKLVALSFDSKYSSTVVNFYNYTDKNNPVSLSNLSLELPNAGGKQSVNRLGFFKRTADNNYYVYGTINSFAKEDGTKNNIPQRTFLAKIDENFTSVSLLAILSYGLNDPKSFAKNSDSLISDYQTQDGVQYTFGYAAPTYVGGHDLFIAFPTGSMGGLNNGTNNFPYLPDPLSYFEKKGNITATCNNSPCKNKPDFRTVSLAVVNMSDLLAGYGLNNSTYFVPLGWNQNVMPYGSSSNGRTIQAPKDSNVSDLNSFSFQTSFWTAYWANTVSNGSGTGTGCYTASPTTDNTNLFKTLGNNTVFAVKNGTNGSNDRSRDDNNAGFGNEVIGISGFDILKANIDQIKTVKVNSIPSGETDFTNIAKYQIIDRNNEVTTFTTPWLTKSPAGPLSPFLYSRTSNVKNAEDKNIFDATATGIANIGMLNFGSGTCLPYWARSTNDISAMGRQTSWLTANPFSFSSSSKYANIYPDLVVDPIKLSLFSFKPGNGSQFCTEVTPTANTPKVFCANFLTFEISKYSVNQSDPVFTSY